MRREPEKKRRIRRAVKASSAEMQLLLKILNTGRAELPDVLFGVPIPEGMVFDVNRSPIHAWMHTVIVNGAVSMSKGQSVVPVIDPQLVEPLVNQGWSNAPWPEDPVRVIGRLIRQGDEVDGLACNAIFERSFGPRWQEDSRAAYAALELIRALHQFGGAEYVLRQCWRSICTRSKFGPRWFIVHDDRQIFCCPGCREWAQPSRVGHRVINIVRNPPSFSA
jgi:hypothetical protein